MSRISYLAEALNFVFLTKTIDALASSDEIYGNINQIPKVNRMFLSNEQLTGSNSYLHQVECRFEVEIEAESKTMLETLINTLATAQDTLKYRSFTITNKNCPLIEGNTVRQGTENSRYASPFVFSYDHYPTYLEGVYLRFELPFAVQSLLTAATLTLIPTNTKTLNKNLGISIPNTDEAPLLESVVSAPIDSHITYKTQTTWETNTPIEITNTWHYVDAVLTNTNLYSELQIAIDRSGWKGLTIGIYLFMYPLDNCEFATTPTLTVSGTLKLSTAHPYNVKLVDTSFFTKTHAYGKINAEWMV